MTGSAGELHGRPWPSSPVPSAFVLRVDRPALVLGSTQAWPPSAPVGGSVEVVRRRSGGGAVLMRPGELLWVDVVVPVGDPRWTADVGRAFWWLGEAWVAALEAVGVGGARWHDGPLVRTPLSAAVCFAGLGPGEVTRAGRKMVGMSSRRRRDAALFQCAALLSWDPAATADALGLGPEVVPQLDGVAAGLDVAEADLEQAFLAALAER